MMMNKNVISAGLLTDVIALLSLLNRADSILIKFLGACSVRTKSARLNYFDTSTIAENHDDTVH